MIPHLYSDKPLSRRNTTYTVTWADWSPSAVNSDTGVTVAGLTITGVTVLDRFSQPDVITVRDVCGKFFNGTSFMFQYVARNIAKYLARNIAKNVAKYVTRNLA